MAMNWKNLLELTTRSPALTVGLLAIVTAALIAIQIVSIVESTRRATALEAAHSYSSAITSIRNYYSSNVVTRAQQAGALATHDYHNIEGAIPLPATLTIELGEQISATGTGNSFRMLSEYPFPWRANGGPKDTFEKEALVALSNSDAIEHVKVSTVNGVSELRLADPVRMKASCVTCHNNHPSSPKTDWKVGDLRGIQTVRVPLPEFLGASNTDTDSRSALGHFAIVIAILVVALALIGTLLWGLKLMLVRQKRLLGIAKQRNKVLAEARRNTESVSNMKSQFLATMSHELRTPLNAVIGFSEAISSEMFGKIENRQYPEFAGHIHQSGERLLEIINNVIDLSKIESGEYELYEVSIEVDDVISKVIDLLEKDSCAENLKITTHIEPGLPQLNASERAVRQILYNLAQNAIKFTPNEGAVSISARLTQEGELEITIEDTGIGMAEKDIELALTPFVQIDGGLSRKFEGTGLGLPLSRKLVEMHGGQLEISSVMGQGTTICIRFPQQRLQSPESNSVAA